VPHRQRETGSRPIVGEGNGLDATSAPSTDDLGAGGRRMNAAASAGSNHFFLREGRHLTGILLEDLRLEHEFQTAMGRQRSAPP